MASSNLKTSSWNARDSRYHHPSCAVNTGCCLSKVTPIWLIVDLAVCTTPWIHPKLAVQTWQLKDPGTCVFNVFMWGHCERWWLQWLTSEGNWRNATRTSSDESIFSKRSYPLHQVHDVTYMCTRARLLFHAAPTSLKWQLGGSHLRSLWQSPQETFKRNPVSIWKHVETNGCARVPSRVWIPLVIHYPASQDRRSMILGQQRLSSQGHIIHHLLLSTDNLVLSLELTWLDHQSSHVWAYLGIDDCDYVGLRHQNKAPYANMHLIPKEGMQHTANMSHRNSIFSWIQCVCNIAPEWSLKASRQGKPPSLSPVVWATADHRCDVCNKSLHLCSFRDTQVHYSAPKTPQVSALQPQQFYSEMSDAIGASLPGKQCH